MNGLKKWIPMNKLTFLFVLLILMPVLGFSQAGVAVDSVSTAETVSLSADGFFRQTPPAELFKTDLATHILQKDKWIHVFPVIAFLLFGVGVIFLVIFAGKSGISNGGEPISMTWAYVLLLFLSVMELVYFLVLKGGTWFCSPDKVGWLMTIVDFILYAALIIMQYRVVGFMSRYITGRSIFGGYKTGIISAAVGIGILIFQQFYFKDNSGLHTIAYVILFGGQVAQFVVNMFRYGVFFSLAVSVIYLICFTALVVLFANFLQLLLIAFLIYCFISALADNSKSPSQPSGTEASGGQGSPAIASSCPYYDRMSGSMDECGYLGYAGSKCTMYSSGSCRATGTSSHPG
jgi:hypothetical protein